MWRRVRIGIVAGCVLAAGVAGWAWGRSYSAGADVHYLWGTGRAFVFRAADVGSIEGEVFFSVMTFEDGEPGRETGWHVEEEHSIWGWAIATLQEYSMEGWIWQGFGVVNASAIPVGGRKEGVIGVAMPHWFIVAGLLGFPAVEGFSWGRRKWRRRGEPPVKCAACGYDLRASPGKCPECGADRGAAT